MDVGANTVIDCATFNTTLIKKGVKLDNLIQIGHNTVIGKNSVIAAQTGIAGSVKIGDNCKIGGQVGIAGHLKIAARNANTGSIWSFKKYQSSSNHLWNPCH